MSENLYHNNSMFFGAPPSSFAKAKELRSNMTEAEQILWEKLKNRNIFRNYKFRRQHPIHLFIADFYCHSLKLVIEIDGDYHQTVEQQLKDFERTSILNELEVEVLRFSNGEVLSNIDEVINKICIYIEERNNER